jgi:hypothetical protein
MNIAIYRMGAISCNENCARRKNSWLHKRKIQTTLGTNEYDQLAAGPMEHTK